MLRFPSVLCASITVNRFVDFDVSSSLIMMTSCQFCEFGADTGSDYNEAVPPQPVINLRSCGSNYIYKFLKNVN